MQQAALRRRGRAARRRSAPRRSGRASCCRRRAVPDDALRRVDRRPHAGVALSAGDRRAISRGISSSPRRILRAVRRARRRHHARRWRRRSRSARPRCPDLALVLCADDLDGPAVEPDRAAVARRHRVRAVHVRLDLVAQGRGADRTRNLSANIDAFSGPSAVAASADDVGVSWLPLNHDMGLVGMALGALYTGRRCVLLPPEAFVQRPTEWLRAITRHRGTISFAPNFAYDLCVRRVKDLRRARSLELARRRLRRRADSRADAGGLRREVRARRFPRHQLSAQLRPRRARARARRFRRAAARPRVECVSADDADRRGASRSRTTAPGPSVALVSCGSALPGHRLRIVGEDGRPLAERHVGEILLAGPSVMLGYYKQDALTAQTIRDGWLHTGDLGYLVGRRAVRLRPRQGPHHRQRPEVSPAGSGMGGRRSRRRPPRPRRGVRRPPSAATPIAS